jgi:hypothetical protein
MTVVIQIKKNLTLTRAVFRGRARVTGSDQSSVICEAVIRFLLIKFLTPSYALKLLGCQ